MYAVKLQNYQMKAFTLNNWCTFRKIIRSLKRCILTLKSTGSFDILEIKISPLNISKASKWSTNKTLVNNLRYTIYYMPSVLLLIDYTSLASNGSFSTIAKSPTRVVLLWNLKKIRITLIFLVIFQN